jgi:glycosyltransferase involved in cell wall biosynthesis
MKQKAYQILLACVKNMPDEVIVYDDGSKDDIQQVASSARATNHIIQSVTLKITYNKAN